MAHLSGLQALEVLNLSENTAVRDRGLASLSRLTVLASLDLSYTSAQLCSCTESSQLGKPRHRNAVSTAVWDCGLAFCGHTNCSSCHTSWFLALQPLLMTVSAAGPAGVSDAGLQAVAALSGLSHLNLDSRYLAPSPRRVSAAAIVLCSDTLPLPPSTCPLMDVPVVCGRDVCVQDICLLTRYLCVWLRRHVTDDGLAHLTCLVKLRALDLFGAKISDAGCAHLRWGACIWLVPMLASSRSK